jgi:hypothetical protein
MKFSRQSCCWRRPWRHTSFSFKHSQAANVRHSEVDEKLAPVNRSHEILHATIFKLWTTFNKTAFVKKQRIRTRRAVESFFLLGDNSWSVARRQRMFGKVKDYGHIYKFNLNHCLVWCSFKKWQWWEILRLFWDKRWTTLCRILQ